jgi:hypothetical protein
VYIPGVSSISNSVQAEVFALTSFLENFKGFFSATFSKIFHIVFPVASPISSTFFKISSVLIVFGTSNGFLYGVFHIFSIFQI